ncbi:MAG: DUF2336 domain-containing protein [Sphingobium sp.]
MSDFSPHLTGGYHFASRSSATDWFGSPTPFVRHTALLDRFFPGDAPKWSDALVARTRRHIAGCMNSAEVALRMALGEHVQATALDGLASGLCWGVLEHNPAAISGDLFAHFRVRAALSLLESPNNTAVHPDGTVSFDDDEETAVRDAALALSLALMRWRDGGDEMASMRADLPAEQMHTLVWITAAILAQAIAPMNIMPHGALLGAIEAAGQHVLAAQDEQQGAFGQAALLAHLLHQRAIDSTKLEQLAQDGHFLLLFAIVADRCNLNAPDVASAIVHGTARDAHLLFRAADMPPACYAITLLALRQVRDGASDQQLGALFDGYGALSVDEARTDIMPLALSAGLRNAFARLGEGSHP